MSHSRSAMRFATVFASLALLLALSAFPSNAQEFSSSERVRVIRTPEGGIQPQAVIDEKGVIHLIYFAGEPARGDLFYTQLRPGKEHFQPSIPVNSEAGSAVAVGTIRGGQLALGKKGRVHVAWNGATAARPSDPSGGSTTDVLAAWETRGEVYFCRTNPKTGETALAVSPSSGDSKRKHPAAAGNGRGEIILVWAEGTGWQKGGALVWQVFDGSGRASDLKGRIDDGIQVWGLATVVARPDQGFTIIR
jgi:hypothetical protein